MTQMGGSHNAVSAVHCSERSAATICFSVLHVRVFLATALPFVVYITQHLLSRVHYNR